MSFTRARALAMPSAHLARRIHVDHVRRQRELCAADQQLIRGTVGPGYRPLGTFQSISVFVATFIFRG